MSDFDYELPEELIAQVPLADRAASRLLHLGRESGEVQHRQFRDVVDILNAGDVLVLNNTRVNAWRFIGKKATGAEIEILVLKEISSGIFECLVKPAKRLKPGVVISISTSLSAQLVAEVAGPLRHLRFESSGELYPEMSRCGLVPLPPYITEALEDRERYQTVVASRPGSAAAPTAGLHFTDEILSRLMSKGVEIAEVTLHVGIDTFRPIQVEDIAEHTMHGEYCEISETAADLINRRSGRLIAVGTTSVRTLESFADENGLVSSGRQESRIFISPGYRFRAVEGMFTNFHFPKTTMLLMISAMAGKNAIDRAYQEAIAAKYRFLSFGDSMLIL